MNKFNVAYFGSQGSPLLNHTPTSGGRAGNRRPVNYAYTVFTPPMSIVNGDLVGGLFWDMRATGLVTGDAAVDQAMGPYTNPVEIAMPDQGCVVLAVSRAKYASQFALVWGANSFNIATWPSNVDQICQQPNNGTARRLLLLLSPADQAQVAGDLPERRPERGSVRAVDDRQPFQLQIRQGAVRPGDADLERAARSRPLLRQGQLRAVSHCGHP